MSSERRSILDALRAECDPVGPNVIADVTGMSRVGVRQLLRSMVANGDVRKVERGKYTVPDFTPHNIDNKITKGAD